MHLVDYVSQFALMASSTPIILRPTSLIPPKATFDSPGSGLATSTATEKEYDLKKQLLADKWRQLFDKYDPEGFGEIPWDDFVEVLKTPEFAAEVAENKRDILAERAQERKTPAITFQDFVNIMSGKRRRSFKCAVHHRDREVSSENDFHIIVKEPPLFRRMIHLIATEFLTDERDRKYYTDHYACYPPPLFIMLITFIELGVFTYYTIETGEMSVTGPPVDSIFLYKPDKKVQLWRFIFYAVVHTGWLHLLFNLLVQLLVGLPLEMVHGSLRICFVFMAGILAGSLGTSVFDSNAYLVGAAGGVYALLAAHLANVLLNYHHMHFGVFRLVSIFLVASVDVGFAVYDRYAVAAPDIQRGPISYAAHLMGALVGLTVGLAVLKNFEQKLHEQLIWWVMLSVYTAFVVSVVAYNVLPSIDLSAPSLDGDSR